MAIAASPTTSRDQRIVIRGLDWEAYRRIAGMVEDQNIRLAYNRGVLELMSPGMLHEDWTKLIARFFEILTEEMEIPCRGLRSTRWERVAADRAIEADECYYFDPDKIAEARRATDDTSQLPPPDIAVEVDMSRSKLDRPDIYAMLGVPEVWQFDGETLRIDHLRQDGAYETRDSTCFLPVRSEEVVNWLHDGHQTDQSAWARRLRRWVREEVAQRGRAGA
jgi:Uma2 family endonuclease